MKKLLRFLMIGIIVLTVALVILTDTGLLDKIRTSIKKDTENICDHVLQPDGDPVPATCVSPAQQSYVCSLCYEVKVVEIAPALGHVFGEWTVAKYPTRGDTGYDERKCAYCDETEQATNGLFETECKAYGNAVTNDDPYSSAPLTAVTDGKDTTADTLGMGQALFITIGYTDYVGYVDIATDAANEKFNVSYLDKTGAWKSVGTATANANGDFILDIGQNTSGLRIVPQNAEIEIAYARAVIATHESLASVN